MKRYKIIKIIIATMLFFCCLIAQNAFAENKLSKTPADYEGPFYPVTKQQDIDSDLVQVKGQVGVAKGDILNLSGMVVNTEGEPLAGAIVEIWQTDPNGRYKHPGDSTPGKRDPRFQYWGAAITTTDGTFYFRTLVPGAYNPRPAHIHYKVLQDGNIILTSQIYFMKAEERTELPSMTSQIELQTTDLQPTANGEFEAFLKIVI
jgi:protocatechuate 3,4-dioxygenase beta subunit